MKALQENRLRNKVNLLEILQQQEDMIIRQSKTITELANKNAEQEEVINALMDKEFE